MVDQLFVYREIEHGAEHIVLRYHLENLLIRKISSFGKGYLVLTFQLGKSLANMSYVTNIFILDLFVIQKAKKIQINWQLIPKFVTNIYLLWY